MSDNNCLCPNLENTTSIPIRGLELAIDSSLLQLGGRTRVTEDLHIYIDGKRTESGDGLTPETAVASYEEAVDVASHYDGCNKWSVYFHFADLAAGEMYPVVNVTGASHETFHSACIRGESYLTTKFERLIFTRHCVGDISNVYVLVIQMGVFGFATITGKVSLQGFSSQKNDYAICLASQSYFRIESEAEVYIQGGNYHAVLLADLNSSLIVEGKIIIAKATAVSWAFAVARMNSSLRTNLATITTQAAVSGKRYVASQNSAIYTGSKGTNFFPGTIAGTVDNGGLYL